MNNEIWKDVSEYEGYYQVSSFGRVKSLERKIECRKYFRVANDRIWECKKCLRLINEKIMNGGFDKDGYIRVDLSKNKKKSTKKIHQLVAIAFLNHVPNEAKLVVNHKNFIKNDNRLDNLEIVTIRENTNKKHLNSSSQYIGVNWYKNYKKWIARIVVNGNRKHLGYFEVEYDAHLAYQKALNELNNSNIEI